MPQASALPLSLVLACLGACGGGSGGGGEPGVKPSAAAQPSTPVASGAASAPTSEASEASAQAASAQAAEASSPSVTAQAAAPKPAPAPSPAATPSPAPAPAPTPAPQPAPAPAQPPVVSITSPGTVISGGVAALPSTSLSSTALSASVSTSRSFASYNWLWSLECAGKAMGANAIPEAGFFAPAHDGSGPELRFGKVADPLDASRRVLQFRAARSDPLAAGAPRCELGFSPTQSGRLPLNEVFWFAFGLHLPGWQSSNDAQIIAQWHSSGGSGVLNPLFAILVKGPDLYIEARSNPSTAPTKAGTNTEVNLKSPTLPNGRWSYFVVQAKISTDSKNGPFLRIWRDGKQIVDHQGPLGYNIPGGVPYAKIGHYHWVDGSNPWPADTPVRTVLMRAPVIAIDAEQRYSVDDLRGYVMLN